MRIAVFSDVHANRHALEAVLADLDSQQPDRVFCLGDLVGYGAFPNEVITLIRERGIPTVMGNYDDGVGFDKDDCGCAYTTPEGRRLGDLSLAWSKEHVSAENKAFLRSLLPNIRLEAEGKRLLLVHGSPRKINEYLYEDRPLHSLERIVNGIDADVLVCGHTHLPYQKTVASTLIVNDGSVGKPKDGDPRAAYVIVHVDRADRSVAVEFRRVAYDVEEAAAAIRASGLPEHFARLLVQAQG